MGMNTLHSSDGGGRLFDAALTNRPRGPLWTDVLDYLFIYLLGFDFFDQTKSMHV